MASQAPCNFHCIGDSELRAFMLHLHHVFFKWDEEQGSCAYRVDVTVQDVRAVCQGDGVNRSCCTF